MEVLPMLFSVSMFPVGSGDSLSRPVAEVINEIDRAHLPYEVSAMDTVIEGEWSDVMPVIERAYQHLSDTHDRVYLTIAVDEHKHGTSRLKGAVEDVRRELGRAVPT
jgi:uncharacterized protein (TIGR00106 family)